MGKQLWLMEYEAACDAFADDGDEAEFRAKLKSLGFDPAEIDDEIWAAKE